MTGEFPEVVLRLTQRVLCLYHGTKQSFFQIGRKTNSSIHHNKRVWWIILTIKHYKLVLEITNNNMDLRLRHHMFERRYNRSRKFAFILINTLPRRNAIFDTNIKVTSSISIIQMSRRVMPKKGSNWIL